MASSRCDTGFPSSIHQHETLLMPSNVRASRLFLVTALSSLLAACGGADPAVSSAATTRPAPSVELAPLTGAEICERLHHTAVASIIGFDVRNPQPSASMTPQCSYPYTGPSGGSYNITVAYQRPDGDLLGRHGIDGFEYVAQMQRGNVKVNPGAEEAQVNAGDKAARFSGVNRLHYGLLLVGGRVMTVTAFTDTVQPAAVDRLLVRMAETFGR